MAQTNNRSGVMAIKDFALFCNPAPMVAGHGRLSATGTRVRVYIKSLICDELFITINNYRLPVAKCDKRSVVVD